MQGSAAVILLNFCAKNLPHRQAEKRCQQAEKTYSELKNRIITILLIFFVSNLSGQNTDRTYSRINQNFSTIHEFEITEITIHSDSTITWKSWTVFDKKDWEKYKNREPEIVSNGKISRNGEFYILTILINKRASDFAKTVKISDRKLIFYNPNKNGKLKKSGKLKRIE